MTTVKESSTDKNLPDGPKAPGLFQLINWIARPLDYIEECVEKYGDVFTIRMFGFPTLVFIAHPQGIKEIFAADGQSFEVGSTNDIARPILGDNSLILMDGARHKRERKLLMPSFHGEKVKSYASSICQITETVASKWEFNKPFIGEKLPRKLP